MKGRDSEKTTLDVFINQLSNVSLFNLLCKSLGADRYIKKLTSRVFLILMILAQLKQFKGLREISACLANADMQKVVGIESIHFSTIARRLAKFPTEVLVKLFKNLTLQCIAKNGLKAAERLLDRINVIDASIISLCLSTYGWAKFRSTKSGIKLHLSARVHGGGVIPDVAVITPAKVADKTQMDILITEDEHVINVFDRGYLDHKKFDSYCEKGVFFVTRLKGNAVVRHMVNLDIRADSTIKSDAIVYLGKGQKQMKHPVRLIETEDTEGNPIRIITNVTDATAEEIGDLYRNRWQIELFFKWIKQHLTVKHFYGQSSAAVENQIYIALITFCLLILFKKDNGCSDSTTVTELRRILAACLHNAYEHFLKMLHRQPQRKSRGRADPKHELIFEHTYAQVMAGETEIFDDLTYDPIVL